MKPHGFVLPILAWSLTAVSPRGSPDPVHHWDFDTDGLVDDVAGGAAQGALMGGATVAGGVLTLDGSTGYVQLLAHLVPTGPPYTVALFARADAGANTGASRDLVSQGVPGAAFYVGPAADGTSARAGDNWPSVPGASFIADGAFHHYALVMSATESAFYVDGRLVATNAPFAGGAGGTPTRFGRGAGSADTYFRGDLDDIRIYAEALDEEEIRSLALDGPATVARDGRRPLATQDGGHIAGS